MKRRYKILLWTAGMLGIAVIGLRLVLSHDSPCGTTPPLATGETSMKGWVHRCYGGPDIVQYEELPKPVPQDDEVIVKVRAASVNPLDWHYMRGKPYVMRMMGSGVGSPKDPLLGVDFAGVVESVGKSVTNFKPGDEVFGGRDGAFSEYVRVRAMVSQEFGFMMSSMKPEDLATLRDMLAAGKIRSVIDRTYKFSEVPEAIRYLETGRARGKVVVRFE